MKNWWMYNHCWLVKGSSQLDLEPLKNQSIWKEGGLFARWETEFDCQEKTEWWHIIKDTPFDLNDISSEYRKKIRRAERNFDVREIDGLQYVDDIYAVFQRAHASYRHGGRFTVTKSEIRAMAERSTKLIFGAFKKGTEQLCGVACVDQRKTGYVFSQLKVDPVFEKDRINEAMVYGRLQYLNKYLANGSLVDAGSRCLSHDTHHQDFLIEKFRFRVAYAHLHFVVNPRYRLAVVALFRMRWVLRKVMKVYDTNVLREVNAILTMMEICEERKAGWRV